MSPSPSGDRHADRIRAVTLALLVASFVALPALAHAQSSVAPDADARVQRLVAAVSETRLRALATTLVGFGTRETLSDTASPTRGIGAARQWILDELTRSSAKLQVTFDTHMIAPQGRITRQVELRNVMAVLPGRSPRRIYISGHYDSVNLGGQRPSRRSNAGGRRQSAGTRRTSTTTSRRPAPTTTAAARC